MADGVHHPAASHSRKLAKLMFWSRMRGRRSSNSNFTMPFERKTCVGSYLARFFLSNHGRNSAHHNTLRVLNFKA